MIGSLGYGFPSESDTVSWKGIFSMLTAIIVQLMGGVRSAMGYTGCRTPDELRSKPPAFVRPVPGWH